MAPKVTLLGVSGNSYAIAYGLKVYRFEVNKTQKVPVVIALEARKKTLKGKPMFRVEGMPEVVVQKPAVQKEKTRIPEEQKKQNVTAVRDQLNFGLE